MDSITTTISDFLHGRTFLALGLIFGSLTAGNIHDAGNFQAKIINGLPRMLQQEGGLRRKVIK